MTAQLVYFADPMCSWCWGFKPSIEAVHDRYGDFLPLRLIMGGLRAGNTKIMDDEQRGYIRNHWGHVADASGQPFNFDFFGREGFVYDTEPACRAVVAMGVVAPEVAMAYMAALQAAFYRDNWDITDREVLGDIGAETGVDRDRFLAAYDDAGIADATQQHFAITQQAGVGGFPTLLVGNDETGYDVVTQGFQPPEPVVARIEAWLAKSGASASSAATH